MGMFDDLLENTESGGKLRSFERVDASVTSILERIYPGLPEDYLLFLKDVGSGEVGGYVIYNGVVEPSDVYDDTTAQKLENVRIFGDDMQGYCSGFDVQDGWSVVEIDPTDMSQRKTFDSFSEFIRNRLKISSEK